MSEGEDGGGAGGNNNYPETVAEEDENNAMVDEPGLYRMQLIFYVVKTSNYNGWLKVSNPNPIVSLSWLLIDQFFQNPSCRSIIESTVLYFCRTSHRNNFLTNKELNFLKISY